MRENEISGLVLDTCIRIHRVLGPGLFESVYEEVLCYELKRSGLAVDRQRLVPIQYESVRLKAGFRADLIVENKVLLELKSVEILHPVHKMQVLTYLKLTHLHLGLLINFNVRLMKEGFHRIVNGLQETPSI